MSKARRTVTYLAREAEIGPDEALARLVAAGVRVKRTQDHVAPKQLHLAQLTLGLIARATPTQSVKPALQQEPEHPEETAAAVAREVRIRPHSTGTPASPTARFLTEADVLRIHYALVDLFARDGDPIVPAGPRGPNLLGSALLRPQTAIGDREKYRTIPQKSGALLHSLIKNHPFHNGNKRTALVSTLAFLDANGQRLRGDVADDDIFRLIIDVAGEATSGDRARSADQVVENVASWWRDRLVPHDPAPSDMMVDEFLQACAASGARVVHRGASHLVQGTNGKAITIRGSVRKLAGGVVKNYAAVLGLAGPAVGTRLDEFQEGTQREQEIISRFMAVLRRLAHS
jgi:death-on-curing family protein